MSDTEREYGSRVPVVKDFTGQTSMTKQAHKDECDVNTIVGRYRTSGFMPHVNIKRPVYEDFSNADDYLSALNKVKAAQELFDGLPARVRARVDNDPAKLIAFVEDPANEAELIELGMLPPVSPALAAPEEAVTEEPEAPPITNNEGP